MSIAFLLSKHPSLQWSSESKPWKFVFGNFIDCRSSYAGMQGTPGRTVEQHTEGVYRQEIEVGRSRLNPNTGEC